MAITYHAGRRLQGSSTDTVETPTFEDDFSSDNWTDTGSQIGVSNNKMVWNGLRNASFQGSYYDLGSSVSETEWELRFTLDIDAMTEGSANAYFNVGLSDTATMNVNTSQDFIGLLLYMDTSSAGNSAFAGLGVNGGTITDSTPIGTADPTALGVFYVRVRRMSATSCIIGIYSNSSYSSLIEEQTKTITSGLDNLQYLKITNLSVASGAGTGVFNGTIDDVKFYNGISTVSSKPTNVQLGSRFEETDTRKMYHYNNNSTTGLKAYWKFNEASGNLINTAATVGSTDAIATSDLVPAGTTGYGATGVVAGVNGYSFDGGDGTRAIASSSSASDYTFITNSGCIFTLCFWAKVDSNAAVYDLFGTSGSGAGDFQLRYRGSVEDAWAIFFSNEGEKITTQTTGDTNYHFYMIQYDDAVGTLKFSIDNATPDEFTGLDVTSTGTPTAAWAFGDVATLNEFAGDMTEFSMWNRLLTSAEITLLYNTGSGLAITDGVFTAWTEEGT